jgi:hypothetical protein
MQGAARNPRIYARFEKSCFHSIHRPARERQSHLHEQIQEKLRLAEAEAIKYF